MAQPLDEQGLLHRLSPETLVDQARAEALTELPDDLLTGTAFDHLDRDTAFLELSHSRLGGTPVIAAAGSLRAWAAVAFGGAI